MSDKAATIGTIRPNSSPAEHSRNGVSNAVRVPGRRLTKLQREQERLDRYGRFGRR